MSRSALVLGGGISGLAAAHRLRQVGWRVELLEAADRLGGSLATYEQGGMAWELGAHTVASTPALSAFARAAGVDAELVPVSSVSRRRYAVHEGRPVAIPAQPLAWLATPLLAPAARWRLLAGRLRRWPPYVRPDETLAQVLRRRLGAAGGSLLAALIATGVYAGDERELLAGETLGPAGRRRLVRPRRGWQAWIDRAGEGVPTSLRSRVVAVRRAGDRFEVDVETPEGGRRRTARRLVLALPAAAATEVLEPLGAGDAFTAVAHAPVAVVVLVCRQDQADEAVDGFGFLDPFDSTGGLLGCIFASGIAPGNAPPGSHVFTALLGGRRHEGLVDADDHSLGEHAWRRLTPLLGLRGRPQTAVVRRWRPGIPQPTHATLVARAAAAAMEARHPALHVLGDWLHGVGVPACVAAAWRLDSLEVPSALSSDTS